MGPALMEWLQAVLRWIHVIVSIMWIGDSLLFMWIETHLYPDPQSRKDVTGVTWLLHGGGYYLLEKRPLVSGRLPPRLRWFWLEATGTWLSGFLLLIVVYYLSAETFMVDPATGRLAPGQAIVAGLGLILGGWLLYEGLWRSRLRLHTLPALAASLAILVALIYAATRLLSARAAFLHVGAMLGTIMAANVWVHILPPQHQMVKAARAGRPIDHSLGEHAGTRSTHNTYLTFPVIFMMLSHHFPGIYASPLRWVVLSLVFVLGASARHVMLVGIRRARWTALAAAAAGVALILLTLPRPVATIRDGPTPPDAGRPVPSFAQVRTIIVQRCASCHSETPTDPAFASPAGGVRFDTPEQIRSRAAQIRSRAVEHKTMPVGNRTGITEEERAALGRWIDAGAPLR